MGNIIWLRPSQNKRHCLACIFDEYNDDNKLNSIPLCVNKYEIEPITIFKFEFAIIDVTVI